MSSEKIKKLNARLQHNLLENENIRDALEMEELCLSLNQSYIVVSVYYKQGEYTISEFKSKAEVRGFLREAVCEYWDRTGEENRQPGMLSFQQLVILALEIGANDIENQYGYGIVSIIQGSVM